ncbi:DUF3027 domain-containing protein [Pseudoscardovia suis]|uniref:DUF3027 domain-containing protein n=1 Tax=Pseudoscardovia suis TaxID=987063 RepID=A0A261F1W7_9BIFI|nr:DUF3027 domain-containing protein [Pseudoscardovia suis]OZG52926.1 hypothetical protein PSSU_0544 [Pseudoscardovia suis]PJJ68430.1 Protein of unknown function (DUF3027) [Pseudoscardovia suis]
MTDVNETLPTDSDQETTPAGVLDMGIPIAPTDEGDDAHGESADEYTDESTTENMTGKNRLEGDADTGDEPAAVDGADADAVDDAQQQSVTERTSPQDAAQFDDEPYPKIDPKELAMNVAFLVAEDETQVGNFVESIDEGDGITDFRFEAAVPGYENWQWSVTLFHDETRDIWTVCESSLVPVEGALLAPPWIPWKDRLEPSDLSPTDSIGTEEDDPRLEDGFRPDNTQARTEQQQVEEKDELEREQSDPAVAQAAEKEKQEHQEAEEIAEEYSLSRRRVLTPLGRSQAAERWYGGPHGPKALSTRTADGKICQTCGFYVSLKGDLGEMFGVCANKWSPDDGKVVSGDHGCGEHSEIAPPAPTPMWIQTQPALDDNTIEIVRQGHRDENAAVEMMEDFGISGDESSQSTEVMDSAETDNDENSTMGEGVNSSADAVEAADVEDSAQSADGRAAQASGEESAAVVSSSDAQADGKAADAAAEVPDATDADVSDVSDAPHVDASDAEAQTAEATDGAGAGAAAEGADEGDGIDEVDQSVDNAGANESADVNTAAGTDVSTNADAPNESDGADEPAVADAPEVTHQAEASDEPDETREFPQVAAESAAVEVAETAQAADSQPSIESIESESIESESIESESNETAE